MKSRAIAGWRDRCGDALKLQASACAVGLPTASDLSNWCPDKNRAPLLGRE